jgi:hypothetical protein
MRLYWENGAPGEIRTPDPLLRRQMLYPAELRARSASESDSKAFGAVPKIKSYSIGKRYHEGLIGSQWILAADA